MSTPADADGSFDLEFETPAAPGEHGWTQEPPPGAPARGPRRLAAPEERLVSLLSPTSFEAEQYRMLRHRVEEWHRRTGGRVIAVTSPAGSDGKTTTAINLAGSLAQALDARVLLVEADLRRPALSSHLGMRGASTPGLVDAILGSRVPLTDIVRVRPRFNLKFVPAGTPPPAAYEVLKSPRLVDLMSEARTAFDYVVVDTPPVVLCPDYRLLERCIDAAMLVVAAHRTPRRLVEQALRAIDPAKLFGLLFNGDDSRDAEYHYSSYPASWGHKRAPVSRLRGGG